LFEPIEARLYAAKINDDPNSLFQPKPKMKKHQLTIAFAVLTAIATAPLSWAGGFTNTFNSGADYVADGILGTSALWDGIYLNDGDVTGGTGSGGGATLQASENIFPGYLTVQSTLGGWEGATDDGFFIYKLVAGDFDVSVQNAAPFDAQNYTFSGLLVRAAEFQDGSPLGGSEDFLGLVRFQEFGLGEGVKTATNGVDNVVWLGGDNSDTNSNRYLRITRVGDVFSFYNKTNEVDAWNLITTQTRDDLTGLPMQVGIQQAVYTANEPVNYFANFALSGPNVATLTPPADPSGVAVSTVNSNTINLSWTPGAGSDGSVVLIRANGPITHKPGDGFVYIGSTNFGDAAGILGGGGVHSVYVGTGSSVLVSGLGGSNNVYSVAVYSYSGTGATAAYGINPASSVFSGPGTLQSVSFTLAPTNIPIGGVGKGTVTATYSSGDSYDVSSDPEILWGSSDSAIMPVSADGIVSVLTSGSATITATYKGIPGNKLVSAHAPVFTDSFSTSHSYLSNGVAGSQWEGIYMNPGDLPGANDNGTAMFTTVADANISSNNVLRISAGGTDWEGTTDDGFFLFKNAPGDFQAVVHMNGIAHMNWTFAGLMARLADADGAPYLGNEQFAALWFFDRFSVITSGRSTVGGAVDVFADQNGTTPVNSIWLLLQRQDGTNFYCYQKYNPGDPWTFLPSASMVLPDAVPGTSVQVGLAQSTYTPGPTEWVEFDSFMLDGDGIGPSTAPPYAPASDPTLAMGLNNTIDINWTPGAGSTGSVVVVRANLPVNGQPQYGMTYTANPGFGLGSEIGDGNFVVYVGSGNSVTVTNITAGLSYYCAVYAYGGEGVTTSYQLGVTTNAFIGVLESVSLAVPGNRIPAGGIGIPKVTGVFSGLPIDITSAALIDSDNTNIIDLASGVLTGFTNGTASISASYGGKIDIQTITVETPTFQDDFGTTHSYLSGVVGTIWDDVYATPGGLPGTTFTSDPSASITIAQAETNVLTVETLNVGWEWDQNDGFFLFKDVPGDFQVAVHVVNTLLDVDTNVIAAYNNPGILARAHGDGGVPFVGGTNESWISWTRFDEFGIGTYARRTLSNNTLQSTQPGVSDGYYWLLMIRSQGTNFAFYQRTSPTEPWIPAPNGTKYSVAGFAGTPMQVGLLSGAFNSGNTATSQFTDFMLDIITPKPSLSVIQSGADVVVSWPEGPGTLQSTLSLLPANWQNVAATLVTNTGTVSVSLPATNSAAFFRLAQ